jgi:hypothetical protein
MVYQNQPMFINQVSGASLIAQLAHLESSLVKTDNVVLAQDAATVDPTSAAKNATCEDSKTRGINRSSYRLIVATYIIMAQKTAWYATATHSLRTYLLLLFILI